MPESAPTLQVPQRLLTEELRGLLVQSDGRGLTTGDILRRLEGRSVALLMVLFSTPFLLPVALPGSSVPLGILLAILGFTQMAGKPPWLPRVLLERRISHAVLVRTVGLLLRGFAKIERLLKVRHGFWVRTPFVLRMHGLYVVLMALVLAVPFPPFPFVGSNAIAAWPIFLLGLGLLERDGLFVGLAYAWFALFAAYWVILVLIARGALDAVGG